MAKAFIGLGANLGDPQQQLIDALNTLKQWHGFELLKYSSLYSSKPLGPQDQPDYVNAVCQINSQYSAYDTLQQLHAIEQQFGRERKRHWGERTLDLDLLLFEQQHSDSAELRLPHPGLYDREFVLYPLAEIAEDLRLPNGSRVTEQCQQVTQNGLHVIFSRASLIEVLAKGAHDGGDDHC